MTERIDIPDDLAGDTSDLRALSAGGFARLGLGTIAYVRPTAIEGQPAFALHAADGTPLAVTGTRGVAEGVAYQNDLQLLTVH